MNTLRQTILKNILDVLVEDDDFAHLFAKSISRMFDTSSIQPGTTDPFESLIDRMIEYSEGRVPATTSETPGLRNNLIEMLREKEFFAFARVLRMLRDQFNYPEARIINYLKKLQFRKPFTQGSDSAWIDIRETSKAIREGLDPEKMKIFAELSFQQRCLLKGFNSEEINVMSIFSPTGLDILSRMTRLPNEQRIMIFSLERSESKILEALGFNRFHFLLNLQSDERNTLLESSASDLRWIQVRNNDEHRKDLLDALTRMSSDQRNTLKKLYDRNILVLKTLTQEAMELAGRINELSKAEKHRYSNLGQRQLDVLSNFTDDQRKVIIEFEDEGLSFNQVLQMTNSLNSQQRDVILSLRQREIQFIVGDRYGAMISRIQHISLKDLEKIRSHSVVTFEEEKEILKLNQVQKSVLLKAYNLGYDGLFMMKQLGLELTNQVFVSYLASGKDKLNVMQTALMKKLNTVNEKTTNSIVLDKTELIQLFRIINHERQASLMNLSWNGVSLLARLVNLDERTIDIVKRLSLYGVSTLTRNDQLTESEILALGSLNESEAKILIDLNIKQREYLSSYLFTKGNSLDPVLFNANEYQVLKTLSTAGKLIASKVIPLSSKERAFVEDQSSSGLMFLSQMSPMELDIFSTLTVNEVQILSSFMVWHAEEDLVFTQWEIPLDASFDTKTEKIHTFITNIPYQRSASHYDNIFKLFANTIEVQRLSEPMDHQFISDTASLIESVHGRDASLIFKMQLLNVSMRDSKSLESLLVPLITGNDQNVLSIWQTKIYTIEDVMFIRWILCQPFDLNEGIFHKFAVAVLYRLSSGVVDQELDILLSKPLSLRDGLPNEQIINGFRNLLKYQNYFLASSLLLSIGGRRNFKTSTHSVIQSLIQTLTPDDFFQIFNTPINDVMHKEISTKSRIGHSSIFSDMGISVPNVLEVSLFYNHGDPVPFLETLSEPQLWKLFQKHTFVLFQMIARNHQIPIFELCQNVKKLKELMKTHRLAILETLIEDLMTHAVYFSTAIHLAIRDTIQYLAYLDSFIGKETYVHIVVEYITYLMTQVSKENLMIIVDSFICEDVNRDQLIKSLKDRMMPDLDLFFQDNIINCCSISKKKRDTLTTCVDSENTKETTNEEEKRIMEQTFDTSVIEMHSKLYDELLEYCQSKFHNDQVNPQIERALFSKIQTISLQSIDPRVAEIVHRIKNDLEDKEKMDILLKQTGTIKRISEVASMASFAFTVFLVGKHLVHGDLNNLKSDALNLWVMPKIGEQITEKLTDLAERYDSAITKGFAPVIGAAIGNLAVFVGLVNALRERNSAVDPVDIEIADLNIVTNSVFIAANIPAVAARIMSSFEVEISVLGELTGPLGITLSVAIVLTSYLVSLKLEVDKLAEHIKLSDQERHSLYWRFFWDESVPDNLRIDVTAKNMYTQYIYNYLHHFKEEYDKIAISLPRFIISEKECIANPFSRFERKIPDEIHYCMGCTLGEKNTSYQMDFSDKVYARNPFAVDHRNNNSRLIPEKLEGYDIVCGPSMDNAIELKVDSNISESCHPDSVHHNTKWDVKKKELFLPSNSNDNCMNIVSFVKHGFLNSSRILLYAIQDATIVSANTNSMDTIFYGNTFSVIDDESTEPMHVVPVNRYYFENHLDDCSVHKKGRNFFYLKGNQFKCNLGNRTNQQHNTVIIRKDFTDSDNNIHSIIGSEHREKIQANFAEFVDGKGGGDVIQATERTIVKGYFDDFVVGRCPVILPLNVSDINTMIVLNRMTIYHKNNASIRVDDNTPLITADSYLLTPIRSSNITHKVTQVHIRKTLNTDIIVENELITMRDIKIPNCNLVRQVSSTNYDIILSDVGQNIFYTDKNNHGFYWESPQDRSDLYILKKLFANVTISNANGILDFRDLKTNFSAESNFFHWNKKNEIEISIGGLNVILLPNYQNVTITFDGKKYFKLENNTITRDYCSHSLRIIDRLKIDGTDLHDHLNCFEFNSNKILFLKLEDDLSLVSDGQFLTIVNYYSSVRGKLDLSLKLNDWIVEPQLFQEKADNPHKLIYYGVNNSGLQIYHNQPIDKHYIGFVDLTNKSIREFDILMKDRDALLIFRNNTLVQIKNWNNYQPSRKLMFAFKDIFFPNARCLISHCRSNDIIEDLQIEKTHVPNSRHKRHHPPAKNNANGRSSWINDLAKAIINPFKTLFHSARALPKLLDDSNYSYLGSTPYNYDSLMKNNIGLTIVLLQSFLNQKYPLPQHKPRVTSSVEIFTNVIDLIEKYQIVFNDTALRLNIKSKNINAHQLYSDILELVKRDNPKRIPNVFYSVAEEMFPRDKEFLTNIKTNINGLLY